MHPRYQKGNQTHWFPKECFTSSKLQHTFHLALLDPLNIKMLSGNIACVTKKNIHRKTHDGEVVYLFLSLLTHQMSSYEYQQLYSFTKRQCCLLTNFC